MERGLWAQLTLHFLIPVARILCTSHPTWGEEKGERFLNWLNINPKGPEREKNPQNPERVGKSK